MNFSNIFSNLESQKLQSIADTRITISELEIKIDELRQFITRTEVERANILESQQVADSALQQLQIAVETIKAISPDAFNVFKQEVIQVLESEPTDYDTAIAYLEGSNDDDVEDDVLEPDLPLLPGTSNTETKNTDTETVIAHPTPSPDEEVKESPVETDKEVVADKQVIKDELKVFPTSDEISNMKKAQIVEWLDKLMIPGAYDRKQNVGELRQLLRSQVSLRRKANTNGHQVFIA